VLVSSALAIKQAMDRFGLRGTLKVFGSAGVALAHSIGHKGALAGAKAFAATALDCFLNPGLVDEAKQTFAEEIGATRFTSLLPEGRKPPLDLNRDVIERFRPQMREHYLHEQAQFD
jgi:aminobenzoyl-glutamate utilization protein B